jgi:coenzyme F420-reducing hydrogenase alpha subunit
MKIDLNVDVHHLTRVEGHGNVRVRVREGRLEEATWEVVETPRFFEVMLKGKHYTTAPILTARICGICSIAHCLASLEATEHAFGMTVPPAAQQLRRLAKHGETLQSHLLHLFFLAAPDLLRVPSVIPLVQSHPEVVDLARRLKGLGNRLCDLVAGRTTHPVTLLVGGVGAVPDRDKLLGFRDELERSLGDLATAAEVVRSLQIPEFTRETEHVSLQGNEDYPFIGRKVVSTDQVERPAEDYLELTNEYVPATSTSKWCRLSRDSFAVGPLARFNNSHAALHPDARKLASALGLEPVCHNPFFANLARLVECMHVTHEAMALIDKLAEPGALADARVQPSPRAGAGVGAVEAPRGILYHHYEYDDDGRIVRADCVIPTTQNHANIQHDLTELVEQHAIEGMTDQELERLCSMLVRSYDPCISCSVH